MGLAWLGLTSCREQQSFVVVTVRQATENPAKPPLTGVTELIVTVIPQGSTQEKILTYPTNAPLTISDQPDPGTGRTGVTLSVSFDDSRSGGVTVEVAARDGQRCEIGKGSTTTQIKKGGVEGITVALIPNATPGPCEIPDGGADGAAITFVGCDPAASTCGAGMTCAVDCKNQKGACVAAGNGAPNTLCSANTDCQPGTQCFTYTGPSCNVGVCLKFCKDDNGCGPAAGTGAGSICEGAVVCDVGVTAYHTCTFGCDPRGAATSGCPAGLHCFVVDTMDQVDCACTEATRIKVAGDTCTQGRDCAPGLICNMMGNDQRCRPVCRRDMASADCPAGQTCTMLTNDVIYGVCL